MENLMDYTKLYINGKWVEPRSQKYMDIINPSTEEAFAKVAEANKDDMDLAIEAARDAFDNGPWKDFSVVERARVLRRIGDLFQENATKLAEIETRESGRPFKVTKNVADSLCQWWYYYAGMVDKIHGETIPFDNTKHIFTTREPIGVVGAITPWNAPAVLSIWKLSVALATGNTVVLKPAQTTPLSAYEIAKVIEKADLPPGVVNVVTGYGRVVGDRLSSHPKVDKISLTGEGGTAKQIMNSATSNFKKLSFELGGKSPMIIFPDANIKQAASCAVEHGFTNTGQTCACNSRVLVHKDIYDEFLNEYKEQALNVKVGDPFDPDVDIGPHATNQQLEKTLEYIEYGKSEGANLFLGGDQPTHLKNGFYVNPTVFTEVDPNMRIAQEEIFGPIASIIPFKDENEAIEISNNIPYGLAAGIWSSDVARAHRVSKELRVGMVWVNTYRFVNWLTPYGGYKASGWGRENGIEAVNDFTELKTTVIDITNSHSD